MKVVCIDDNGVGHEFQKFPIKGKVYNVTETKYFTNEGHGSRINPISGKVEYYGISEDIVNIRLYEFGETWFNLKHFKGIDYIREKRLNELGI